MEMNGDKAMMENFINNVKDGNVLEALNIYEGFKNKGYSIQFCQEMNSNRNSRNSSNNSANLGINKNDK